MSLMTSRLSLLRGMLLLLKAGERVLPLDAEGLAALLRQLRDVEAPRLPQAAVDPAGGERERAHHAGRQPPALDPVHDPALGALGPTAAPRHQAQLAAARVSGAAAVAA